MRAFLISSGIVLVPALLAGQQVEDSAFRPRPALPWHAVGTGPVVAIDAAHQNFHTRSGRYQAFARVLEADGDRVVDFQTPFTAEALAKVTILVIANAGMPDDAEWKLPSRSAFTQPEIDAVARWVEGGGALLVIADHFPAGGTTADLVRRFGAELTNGYSMDRRPSGVPGDLFTRADRTLLDHPITRGRRREEAVDSVLTFTGQAFQVSPAFSVLLRFGPNAITWLPTDASARFDSLTPMIHTGGWAHAAARTFGRGRVVIFGEAGGFSAQLSGPGRRPMGLNHPAAVGNQRFLVNAVRWLARGLD
jgi:hypothetical protein